MTIIELARDPALQSSAADGELFLQRHALAIHRLFYSDVADQAISTHALFDYEHAFEQLVDTPIAHALRGGRAPASAFLGLLVFFLSLFERAALYAPLHTLADTLPQSTLRDRCLALFHAQYITNSATDSTVRLGTILTLLQSAWAVSDAAQRIHCEDLLLQFFWRASTAIPPHGAANHERLLSTLRSASSLQKYPLLAAKHISSALNAPFARAVDELDAVRLRIAEALFDEATGHLPAPQPVASDAVCLATGRRHGGACPSGLHAAREELARRHPQAYANTTVFIRQALSSAAYAAFSDAVKCMRYFRQYMPLHMPQIEAALVATLDEGVFARRAVHILDIGGGPGTLYAVLASLLQRQRYAQYHFTVSLAEPSTSFHDFFRTVAARILSPKPDVGAVLACTCAELPSQYKDTDVDWYFIGNALTPIAMAAGTNQAAARCLLTAITGTRRPSADSIMTLAENTNTTVFQPVCDELRALGCDCVVRDTSCPGAWLGGCKFYVTGAMRPTQPRLKYARVTIPRDLVL